MTLIILVLGCTGAVPAPADESTSDDSATPGDTLPACAVVSSGDDWAWGGECPRMRTPCDIVVEECGLTLDYAADGGMTMGMPYSATIDGDTVTFADDGTVTGCVGTVTSADAIEGTCGDGCTFTLRR